MTIAIRCADLTVCYGPWAAVHHLDVAIASGSLTALVGPNGAGKTTLLNAVAGLLPPRTGSIQLAGEFQGAIGYLPQQSLLERDVPLGVGDLVSLGTWRRCGAFREVGGADARAVDAALDRVGLGGFRDRSIGTLSSGQLQRALFARVLVEDARLILLDEPFNAIDARTTADLLDVVAEWHAERRTVVAVLHDLDLVRAKFPESLLVAREGIAHGPTHEALSATNLQRARAMAEAWSESAPWCERVRA